MDRNIAEVLAARALRIAFAVLGDRERSLNAVTRAAESVRQQEMAGHLYEVHLLTHLVAHLRKLGGGQTGAASETAVSADEPLNLNFQCLCVDDRIVIALCSIDGLSYSAAARLIGVSKPELLMRLAAARRRLWAAGC